MNATFPGCGKLDLGWRTFGKSAEKGGVPLVKSGVPLVSQPDSIPREILFESAFSPLFSLRNTSFRYVKNV